MKAEIERAKLYWIEISHFRKMEKYFSISMITEKYPRPPEGGWLKFCREAALLSQNDLSKKIGTSRQGYAKMELNEAQLSLTLESLAKAAEALDCELIYFLRPKPKKRFSDLLWEKILPEALFIYQKFHRHPQIRPYVLAHLANKLLSDSNFRRKMSWTQQRPERP